MVKAGRAIRLLGWLGLVFTSIYWAALVALNMHKDHPEHMLPPLIFTASITTALSVLYIVTGAALIKSKSWSRYVAVFLGVVMLMIFPVGTLLGIYTLWCVIKGWNESNAQ